MHIELLLGTLEQAISILSSDFSEAEKRRGISGVRGHFKQGAEQPHIIHEQTDFRKDHVAVGVSVLVQQNSNSRTYERCVDNRDGADQPNIHQLSISFGKNHPSLVVAFGRAEKRRSISVAC
jgi:hypothetical protein